MNGNARRRRSLAAVLATILAVAGCSATRTAPPQQSGSSSPRPSLDIIVQTPPPTLPGSVPGAAPTMPAWFGIPMTDVNSGQSFTIQEFAGKVVLVETMATWCPTCQGEMSQVRDLLAMLGPDADLVAVSLDVDPNEDAALLKKYAAANGFAWRVAVAPTEVGRFLARTYDVEYLNPPLQPMLFIDRHGSVYGLPFGTKSAVSLRKTLDPYLAR